MVDILGQVSFCNGSIGISGGDIPGRLEPDHLK